MCYTREQIERAVKSKGYTWFEDADNQGYDVNIVGVTKGILCFINNENVIPTPMAP